MTSSGSLHLIMGPMFSGKTTKLIELYYEKVEEVGKEKCLAFNYALDKRYGENKIISHDGKSIDCHAILDLGEFINDLKTHKLFMNAQYIFINEAQFFSNLFYLVEFCKNTLNKHLILCGLDLDFKRNKFGDLLSLQTYADNVEFLTGKCDTDGCTNPSKYSHRVEKTNTKQVLIGTKEYIPLCGECYNKFN